MKKILYPIALSLIILLSACAQQGTPQVTPTRTNEPAEAETPTESSGYPYPAPPEIVFQPTEVPGYPEPPDQPSPTVPEPAYPAPDVSPTPSISSVAGELLWVSSGTDLFNRVVSTDPLNPERIAYCANDEIRVSLDNGQTWEGIPTSGVAAAAAQIGYPLFERDPASSQACLSVTLDPIFPNSYYAVFTTAQDEFGAPPVFYMGFFTADNGQNWQLVPPPDESNHTAFGGYWSNPSGLVEALFSTSVESVDPSHPVYVQKTGDGGQTWKQDRLSCPASGPCLRWGAAASNIPGMGSPLPQDILVSLDQGETWEVIEPPVELRTPSPNQLVAYSDQIAEIISGSIALSASAGEKHPIRTSQDGGQTWQVKALPPLPDEVDSEDFYPGLQILPDGSYLSQNREQGSWFWLADSSEIWCPLEGRNLPAYPVLLQSGLDRLWWVDGDSGDVENFLLEDIACSED
jgi:hypothetical protein